MNYIKIITNNLLILLVLLFSGIFLLQTEIHAQQPETIQVKGTVLDATGLPLTGATIVVEGTSNGTVTDIDGNFSIECPKGGVLSISFMGYKGQQFTVTSADKVNVTLEEDIVALDEAIVVAVGYGTMRKSDLTGAITSVSSEKFKKGIVSSSEQLLQGKVAGLTVIQGSGDPASGSSLRLRGGTSLKAGNSPLIVVDGIPGVDFNSVQPSEIVSIDILKDASAAAIYGSRGANGVIIVTTNRANKGTIAEYNGYVAFGTVANHLDLLSADQWRAYVRENNLTNAPDYGANTDWQKELEQTSISHSHALSFSNAGEKGGYRISLNYLYNDGIIKTSHLDRFGGSVSAFQNVLNDRLKIEAGVHTNFDKWTPTDNAIFERAYNINPTIPVYDENGEFTEIPGTAYENPVEIFTNRTANNARHRFLGFAKADLEIVKGLKGVANFSYEYNSAQYNYYLPSYSFWGRTVKGVGSKELQDYRNMQLETYLNYTNTFASNQNLGLMVGYSYLDNTYSGFRAQNRGFDTDLFLYNSLQSGLNLQSGDVSSYKGEAVLISFFGRLNYSYKGRYMLTATLRRDGSSRFGANNKWGWFPSTSVAWRISDESFMAGLTHWVSNVKLRVGYGVTGNQDGIGEYKSLSIMGSGSDKYYDPASESWKQGYVPTQNPNPNLKWESTSQINAGLDFTLLNRIFGTLDIYSKYTSDLLYVYNVKQPPNLFPTTLANVGDLSNKGIELTLNANIMNKADFSWDVTLSLAHNKQKIEKLSNDQFKTEAVETGDLHNLRGMSNQFAERIIEGYPVGTFWGPKCLGIDSSGMFVLDGHVEYDSTSKKNLFVVDDQYLGNVQPKFTFGLGTTLTYWRFDLDIATYGMIGQKVLNATAMSMADPTRMPIANVTDEYLKSGVKDEPTYCSYWIEDASFFRLQTVTLGYKMKAAKLGLENIRLYVSGENLLVVTNYSGIDPEISIDGLDRPGMDMFNYYPKPRTFIVGLNISF
jgi:TonB-dependent starch-binding outer membrane protein SusC